VLALLIVLVLALVVIVELRRLRQRVEGIERELERRRILGLGSERTPATTSEPAPSSPPVWGGPPATLAPGPTPSQPLPPPAFATVPRAPNRPRDELSATALEQRVGGIWLQNVGAVLLLFGAFLMIVWGYTSGRLGAGALVASGVGLGLALVWRGDRTARTVRAFGHALIGIGLGVVYLSIYLGHFRLHALGPVPAFALLTAVSIGTVATGLRYRVITVAALGVIGAFVPQILAAWVPFGGFLLPPERLLVYLAFVDGVVFALVASAGWSGLALTAVLLSAGAWISSGVRGDWGWANQLGLSALFSGLALAPLPRLSAVSGRVRNIDLMLVAAAPLCFLAASSPFLVSAEPRRAAMLLIGLSAVQVAAAAWVDARRPERDLWQPLTGAAVLYLTFALERVFGGESTPLAWTIEGVVLVVLGTRERGGWLRLCGSLVTALGLMWLLVTLIDVRPDIDDVPVFRAEALRTLVCIAAVLTAANVLSRGRRHLSTNEVSLPEIWTVAGHTLLAAWLGRESMLLANWLVASGRGGFVWSLRRGTLDFAVSGALWMAQAFALVVVGRGPRDTVRRVFGSALALIATLATMIGAIRPDDAMAGGTPFAHVTALLPALACAWAVAGAVVLARRRHALAPHERRLPEAWAMAATLLLLPWSARECGHLARSLMHLSDTPEASLSGLDRARLSTMRASLTSVAWIVEAVVLLAVGWIRRSAFLRWSALALVGITLLKFALVDLRTVDPFWRFLTAIAVGVVLLAISYLYQARLGLERRADAETPVEPADRT
jgi:uncharacterized membrane protein